MTSTSSKTTNRTHKSSRSKGSSRRGSTLESVLSQEAERSLIKAATRKAELQCRAEALKEKVEMEAQELELMRRNMELKHMKELLEVRTEIKVEEAKISVLGTAVNSGVNSICDSSRSKASSALDLLPRPQKEEGVKKWLTQYPQSQYTPLNPWQQNMNLNTGELKDRFENSLSKMGKCSTGTDGVATSMKVKEGSSRPLRLKKGHDYESDVVVEQNGASGSICKKDEVDRNLWDDMATNLKVNMVNEESSVDKYDGDDESEDDSKDEEIKAPLNSLKQVKTLIKKKSTPKSQETNSHRSKLEQEKDGGRSGVKKEVNDEEKKIDGPCDQEESTGTLKELMKIMIEQQKKSTLPHTLIPSYNGDPLEFCSFMQSFKYNVELKTEDNFERVQHLDQCTTGEPNRIVKGLLNRNPNTGYEEAKKEIKRKFGDKYVIADAFKKKAERWPDVKREDGQAWTKFSIFLVEYENSMKDLGCLNEVDHSGAIRMLLSKIPYAIRNQWRIYVDTIQERQDRMAGFSDFVKFIDRQARIVTNPLYGHIEDSSGRKSAAVQKARSRASFATGTFTTPSSEGAEKMKLKRWCFSCNSDSHFTDSCRQMLKKPYQDRLDEVKKLGLCFACLKKGKHVARDCKNRLTCKTCKGRHPTILHRELNPSRYDPSKHGKANQENNVDVNTSCGLTGAGISSLLSVVPVTVYSSETGRQVNTYALLDSKSTSVFCTKSLQRKLSVPGKKTRIRIQTINGVKSINTHKLEDLIVADNQGNNNIDLPEVYIQNDIPVSQDDIVTKADILPWKYLSEVNVPEVKQKVELLIGNNVPRALEPLRIIHSESGGPFACQTILGWEVHGLQSSNTNGVSVHRIKAEEEIKQQLATLYNQDFTERLVDDSLHRSQEDKRFLRSQEGSMRLTDHHYEMPLPLRNSHVTFPDNRVMAENRTAHLKRKFQRNPEFKSDYIKAMSETIKNGYAEPLQNSEVKHTVGRTWYIPHHGVRHPRKHKLRVVYDCAATFGGTSLNKELLQGPDLTSTLVGVLLRFRQEPIAVMADVQGMFNQVKVSEEYRDLLRFLWWPNGDTTLPLAEYRMTTHLFGAVSSPACANLALRRTAVDNKCSEIVRKTINRNFYVDDCLKSIPSEEEAVKVVNDLTSVLRQGGFKLTKWVSNSSKVMAVIPENDRAMEVKSLDLNMQESIPPEVALGVLWSPNTDRFGFRIKLKEHPQTRRGILSTVSSLYDPLGLVAPAILPARLLLQDLCRLQLSWDDDIPLEHQRQWNSRISDLPELEHFSIARCVKPPGFESPKMTQLHHFADASSVGYGTVSYLRLVNNYDEVHCQLLMSKSRVAPLKKITIPRMELTAATVAVRMDSMLRRELELPIHKSVFWTDSTTVLGYISNDASRFQTFVANRVELIRESTEPLQWKYVKSESNPADECSRGLTVQKFLNNTRWMHGPQFLQDPEDKWPEITSQSTLDMYDPEVKKQATAISYATVVKDSVLDRLLTCFSSWHHLKRAVAWILRIKKYLLYKVRKNKAQNKVHHDGTALHRKVDDDQQQDNNIKLLTVSDVQEAELAVVKYVQSTAYAEEIESLGRQSPNHASGSSEKPHVKGTSSIRKLCPFLKDGILRVGGRLSRSALPEDARFPMVLPKSSPISELILRDIHENTGHGGRNHILHRLRQRFWIVNANSCARKIVTRCVTCRKYSKKPEIQYMADLPKDRVTPDHPPFTNVGMDFFGPFYVKVGRSSVKRYGAIFTCMATRAVHIEKAANMDTSACINVIRRFIARRGQVQSIRSDNGTNMVGAESVLRQEINKLNQTQIHTALLQKSINWIWNPPSASHHGGVWERLIRSTRKALNSVLREQVLTDDNLHTLLCEVEGILNSRPITKSSGDAKDLEALTPNHLLLLKGQAILPPNLSEDTDQYVRRRWRQVQYLANIFWQRWIREYLPQLQERQKWLFPRRNIQPGDIVLVVDDTLPRNTWKMGKILETFPDKKGSVRQVKVKTRVSIILRPISKLCLLLEAEIPEEASKAMQAENENVKSSDKHEQNAGPSKVRNDFHVKGTRTRPCIKPRNRLDL